MSLFLVIFIIVICGLLVMSYVDHDKKQAIMKAEYKVQHDKRSKFLRHQMLGVTFKLLGKKYTHQYFDPTRMRSGKRKA